MPDDNGKKRKPVSTKQIEANRRNAKKAKGPKDTSLTRFNALKHGLLTKEVVISSGDGKESEEEFHNLLEELNKDCNPQGAIEEMLVEKIAVSYWRLRRALRYERGLLREELDSLYYDYYYGEESWADKNDRGKVRDRLEMLKGSIGANLQYIELLKDGLDITKERPEDIDAISDYYNSLVVDEYTDGNRADPDLDEEKFFNGELTISELRKFLQSKGWKDEKLRKYFIERSLKIIDKCEEEIKKIEERETLKVSRLADLKSLVSSHDLDKLQKYEGAIEKQLYRALDRLERMQRMRAGAPVPPPINLNIINEK